MNKAENYFRGDTLAASVFLNKYALENEETPKQMHIRMAEMFNFYEQMPDEAYQEPYSEEYYQLFNLYHTQNFDYFKYLEGFKYIVPQGSIMSQLGNTEVIGSLSNCFVVESPYDSYAGIFHTDQHLAQLMKRRGGVGVDISTLRPDGTPVNNPAVTSTGAVSFMERFSNTTREVAQNGRRGALMLSIDVRHPDVEKFALIKRDELKVTGANISIQLRDDFMEAVENDTEYQLQWPVDSKNPEVTKTVNAKELYETIIESAWMRAEPGLMFKDRHLNYSPDSIYPKYKGICTNPCGEIWMGAYDACRLMALNLYSFVDNPFTDSAKINYDMLYHIAYVQQRMMDIIVTIELEKIRTIINKLYSDSEPIEVKMTEILLWEKILTIASSGRRTGSGFTGLGDMLAALNVPYDSDKAMKIVDRVMKTKFKAELNCSIDLAIENEPFDGWNKKREYEESLIKDTWYHFVRTEFPDEWKRMQHYGRRNVSFSTVAPTGSVSLLTQTTSGLEPLFAPWYFRRVKINPGEDKRVDFVDKSGDSWQNFPVFHPKFIEWYYYQKKDLANDTGSLWTYEDAKNYLEKCPEGKLKLYFEDSPWYNCTANDIDWTKRVELQGIIQKYTTHSISSTINLPNDVSQEEVATIYTESWKRGLKGVTVYRDGCRSGVLITKTEEENEFKAIDAPKRPKSLPCDLYTSIGAGQRHLVIIGLMNEKPYEIFALSNWDSKKPPIEHGFVKKVKRGQYDIVDENDEVIISNITEDMNHEEENITRMTSTALRHHTPIQFIVDQLNKHNGPIHAFSRVLSRTLKRYVPDGVKSSATCQDCGSHNVVYQEGCQVCMDCGSSKCG